jgi:alkylhydroperoxidase family enzyme
MSDSTVDELFAPLPKAHEHYRALDEKIWDGRLDPALLEVCRVRIAMLHRCAPQLTLRRADLGDKRAAIAQWPTSPLFNETERAVLRFAEQYVIDAQGVSDADAALVTTVLSGPQVADFTIAIGAFDAICRFTLALGSEQTPAEPAAQDA